MKASEKQNYLTQINNDLKEVERKIEVAQISLELLQKHQEYLKYFLDILEDIKTI